MNHRSPGKRPDGLASKTSVWQREIVKHVDIDEGYER